VHYGEVDIVPLQHLNPENALESSKEMAMKRLIPGEPVVPWEFQPIQFSRETLCFVGL
jgi:hypothetical protein